MTDSNTQRQAVFGIFRDLRACQFGAGRLLYQDVQSAWQQAGDGQDRFLEVIQNMVDEGLADVELVDQQVVIWLTERGVAEAISYWQPKRVLGRLMTRMQAQLARNDQRLLGMATAQ